MSKTPESILVLAEGALYQDYGLLMIAVSETEMVEVFSADTPTSRRVATKNTELVCLPGTPDWVTRMTQTRERMARDLSNERGDLRRKEIYLEGLGQALLEKAIEKQWCEEYDEFAEEWDLPKMMREISVNITVTVYARSTEDAIEKISANLGFDSYSEGVVQGPDIEAEEL